MSPSARRRIADAQKKRWAAFHKTNTADKKPVPKATAVKAAAADAPVRKRKMSAAGRKAIIEATKKRWAAFHKAKESSVAKKAAATKPTPKKAAVKKNAVPAANKVLVKKAAAKAAKKATKKAAPTNKVKAARPEQAGWPNTHPTG
jgi:hypothetical protein